ncbi:MAG: hypothetical protein LBV53_01335 [Mycoplasmataceae bacterium]|jgi:hypothetical protein|nr:hypothetical protein [Mycoplasmataceae bacterium]
MNVIRNIFAGILILFLILVWILFGVTYEVVETCRFYYYETNNYFIITPKENKFIHDSNQKLKMKYKDHDIIMYLNSPTKQDGIYLYNFYTINPVTFDYGLNEGTVDFGPQRCILLIF